MVVPLRRFDFELHDRCCVGLTRFAAQVIEVCCDISSGFACKHVEQEAMASKQLLATSNNALATSSVLATSSDALVTTGNGLQPNCGGNLIEMASNLEAMASTY